MLLCHREIQIETSRSRSPGIVKQKQKEKEKVIDRKYILHLDRGINLTGFDSSTACPLPLAPLIDVRWVASFDYSGNNCQIGIVRASIVGVVPEPEPEHGWEGSSKYPSWPRSWHPQPGMHLTGHMQLSRHSHACVHTGFQLQLISCLLSGLRGREKSNILRAVWLIDMDLLSPEWNKWTSSSRYFKNISIFNLIP